MASLRLLFPAILCASVLAGTLCAQSAIPPPRPPAAHSIPPVKDLSVSSPFALDGSSPVFRIVPESAMPEADKDLLAQHESDLRRQADLLNLGYGKGNWTYAELACASFPNHLLLRFLRNNGKGDVSMFSASIPRGNDGKLRIIPVLRRGYSLFSPAPVNPGTIAAFNRIREEEKSAEKPAWADIGRCYAALAGAAPQASSADAAGIAIVEPMPPTLDLTPNGRATIRFVTLQPESRRWAMIFDSRGRLLAAKYTLDKSETLRVHTVKAPAELRVSQVPPGTMTQRPVQ